MIGEQELRSGCELSVGPLRFLVQLDVAVGGEKHPPVHSVGEAAERTAQLARGGEDSIDDWLDESDPSGSDTGLVSIKGATQRRADRSHNTNESKKTTINDSKITDSKILAANNADDDHAKAESAGNAQQGHKKPGKLPRVDGGKEKPADTQTAVRDALRKLREKKQKKG